VTAPETVLVICRFVFDAAAIFLWGAAAYLVVAVPRRLAGRIAARLASAQRIAVILAILALILLLPAESAMIGDGWDSVDISGMVDVMVETGVGWAWMAQAAGTVFLLCLLTVPAARRQAATAVVSALLLATLAISGHAAMDDGWLGIAHQANHVLHLLSGGAWLGALVPVLLILRRLAEQEARLALMRFSTLGHGAVALVIVTGLINTFLIVGKLPLDWSFLYQILLSAKIALAAAMTILAVINRYVFVPRLKADPDHAVKAILRGTVAEIILGAIVLALVAWFGTLDPH
jgi:putative copper resistance protein D